MNLVTLVTTIGQRTGLIGPRDQAACRAFLQLRYDQLWRLFLWKDSLVEFVTVCDPGVAYTPLNNFMPTKGNLILPPIIGKVIAARNNTDKMNVQRPMIFYRVSQDAFARTGMPMEFLLLSACVWEFDVPQAISLDIINAGDVAKDINVDMLQPDGVTVLRMNPNAPTQNPQLGNSDRIDAFIKPAGNGPVLLQVGATTITTIATLATSAPKSQRIKFVSTPDQAFTARILGKRVTPSFTDDNDEPAVAGMDGILYAMATYDMAHRDEFSKIGAAEGQMLLAESVGPDFLSRGIPGGFLKTLVSEECDQAAWNSRIMPEFGFGGDEFLDNRPAKNAA